MKITSCDCFDEYVVKPCVIIPYGKQNGKYNIYTRDITTKNNKNGLIVRLKLIHRGCIYCPHCGKKIEVNNGTMHNLVKIVFKDESSSFLRDVNDEELQKSLKEKGWHEFSDGQMVNMDEIREIIPIRTGD